MLKRLKLTLRLSTTKKDFIFTKAFAIGVGALIGGGISLYWRETRMVGVYKKRLEDLEAELEHLKEIKEEKEQLLRKALNER